MFRLIIIKLIRFVKAMITLCSSETSLDQATLNKTHNLKVLKHNLG